jgi:hypothetical protein
MTFTRACALARVVPLFALIACSSSPTNSNEVEASTSDESPDAGTDAGMTAIGPQDSGTPTGDDASDVPPPAFSPSFSPWHATSEDGGVAILYWRYRVDHGQPTTMPGNPGDTFLYADTVMTSDGMTHVTKIATTLTTPNGSGSELVTQTSILSPSTGASTEGDVNSSAQLPGGSASIDAKVVWDAPGLPAYLDRTDLDTLSVGYSETVPAVQGTATTTVTSSSAGSQTAMSTASAQITWQVMAQLSSFAVLGVTYKDVVNVQVTTTTTTTTAGSPSTETDTELVWLARGIGSVQTQTTSVQQGQSTMELDELVTTNLRPSEPAADAGTADAADGGGEDAADAIAE